jgi:hypothetical protein
VTSRIRRLRWLTLFGASFLGLVGAHLLGYALIEPGSAARSAFLAETGHGYLSRLTEVAVAAGILAGLSSALLAILRSRTGGGGLSLPEMAFRLMGLQVAGFLVLELLERTLSGAPVDGLAAVLAVGTPLQVILAWAGATLISLLERAVEAVAISLRRPLEAPSARPLGLSRYVPARPTGALRWAPRPIRGPPSFLLADR